MDDSDSAPKRLADRHADGMRRLTEAILESPGGLAPPARRAIEARAARRGGPQTGADDGVLADLEAFVEKVARHAYRVTDADVDGLRAAGYSEDAIFEATLAAALGAGRARLERGLAALREAR